MGIRLCIVSSSFLPTMGGLQVQLDWLLSEISQNHDYYSKNYLLEHLSVLIPNTYSGEPTLDRYPNVNFDFYPYPKGILGALKSRRRISSLLNEKRPNIVHCHNVVVDSLILPSKKTYKKIVTSHGGDLAFSKKYDFGARLSAKGRLLARLGLRHVDLLISVSQAQAEFSRGLISEEKVKIVPNMVTTPDLEKIKKKNQAVDDAKVFLLMGGDRPVKDHPTALTAFSQHLLQFPKSKLMLIGSASHSAEVKQLIAKLGISNSVALIGTVQGTDKIKVMEEADFFISTSHYEAFGLASMEAACSGIPVILASTGAVPELFTHKKNALLFEEGDVADLVRLMNRVVKDRQLAMRLSSNGKTLAKTYSSKNVTGEIFRIYLQLLGEP